MFVCPSDPLRGHVPTNTFDNQVPRISYTANGAVAELTGVDASVYKKSLLDAFASDGKQYGLPESFSDVRCALRS